MPWPRRIRRDRCDAAARKTSGAEEWEYSSRKWCSTSQGVIEAQPVGQLDLGQRVLEELELGPVFPGPRQLVLVEDPESHGQLLSGYGGIGQLPPGLVGDGTRTEHRGEHQRREDKTVAQPVPHAVTASPVRTW